MSPPSGEHAVGVITQVPTFDEDLLCCLGPAFPDLAETDPSRIAHIASELAAGFEALRDVHKAVSIFGSARVPRDHPDYLRAREVAAHLGRAGFAVITGGGPGIMEAANRGAQEVGALSIGVTIELPHEQAPNHYLDVVVPFRHFFARKVMFVRYASGFVALPGGYGTLDELFEALTLIQTGKVKDFPIVLISTRYWSGLVDWLRDTVRQAGKISAADLSLVVTDDVQEVGQALAAGHARQPRAARRPS